MAATVISPTVKAQDEDARAVVIKSQVIVIQVDGDVSREKIDVFLDDLQVNSFARFEAGKITIELPFSDQSGPFMIVIQPRDGSDPIFSKKYQFAESKYYDTIKTSSSFQNDTVWKINSNARPKPDQFDRREVTNDFRAEAKLEVTKGQWATRFDGELTGSNDSKKRLRKSDGGKTDLTRGIGIVEFRDNTDIIQASVGDVTVTGGLETVNQGFSSRGMHLLSNWFGDRLKINMGNAYGSDVRGLERGIEGFREDNRRTAANISADVVRSANVGLTLQGSWLDVKRPSASNFGFGQVSEGEENTVVGGGIKLALFDSRIQLQSEVSGSEYANPESLNTANEFGNSTDVGTTEGTAQYHRADVEVWRGDTVTVRSHTSYRLVEPLFFSVQSGQIADRETWDYGVSTSYDFITVTVGRNIFENNVDDINSILKTRQKRDSASLDFSFDEFREIPEADPEAQRDRKDPKSNGFSLTALRLLIPSSVQITNSNERVKALNADVVGANSSINGSEIPDQVTDTAGITMTWNWAFGSTSLTLSESELDTRQSGRETADTEDRSLGFDQSYTSGPYSASFRLGLGEFENNETTSRSKIIRQETAVNASVDLEDLPRISGGVDVSRSREFLLVNDTEGITKSWRVNGSLDFTKFVPKLDESVEPYLTLNGSIDQSYSRTPGGDGQMVKNYSVSLAFGFKF